MGIGPIDAKVAASSSSGPAYSGSGGQYGAPITTGQVMINTGSGSQGQATAAIPWVPILVGGVAVLGVLYLLARRKQ